MNAGFVRGEAPAFLDELVAEAVSALGYVQSGRTKDLTALFRRIWPLGTSQTMLMSRDGGAFSEFNSLLTAKGRSDPQAAAKATALRVIFNVQRRRFDQQEAEWSGINEQLAFKAPAAPEFQCVAALSFVGQMVGRADRPALPLEGCDKDWCPCRWDMLPSDEGL